MTKAGGAAVSADPVDPSGAAGRPESRAVLPERAGVCGTRIAAVVPGDDHRHHGDKEREGAGEQAEPGPYRAADLLGDAGRIARPDSVRLTGEQTLTREHRNAPARATPAGVPATARP
jgi:hypothetical protein